MAFDPGPCGAQFEDWEDLYLDWQNKNSDANVAAAEAAVASTAALAICGGTWWTGVGLLGCAAAAALALAADGVSIDASLARNAAAAARNTAKAAYDTCVGNHKWYYGEQ